MQEATMIVGLLVGFLMVSIIGIYVGDALVSATNLSETDPLYESQVSILDTFNQCISLVRIVLLVAIVAVVFRYLQGSGLIPGFGGQRQGGY